MWAAATSVASLALAVLVAGSPAQATGARLSGTIVAANSAARVGGAVVTLNSSELTLPISTVTDRQGAFMFDDLPAGEFTLEASKPAFLPLAYGARAPGEPGVPIRLLEGESQSGIVIALPRGAVITGTIRDWAGTPAADLTVSAFRLFDDAPASAAGSATTDDRGVFRMFGLGPGDYIVGVTRAFVDGGSVESPSAAENDRRLAALARRGGASGAAPPSSSRRTPVPTLGFAPVFYPGTTDPAAASHLTIAAGAEYHADFAFGPVPAGVLRGEIRTADGAALPSITLRLEQRGPQLPIDFANRPRLTVRPAAADGRFAFEGVTPGQYTMSARSGAPRGRSAPLLWASQDLTATGQDVAGVVLTLREGLRLAGTIVAEPPSLIHPESVRVLLKMLKTRRGTLPPLNLQIAGSPSAPVRADGSFQIDNIVPGTYAISVTGIGSAWLRSALVDGQDGLDVPIVVGEDDRPTRRVVLHVTDRRGRIFGRLDTPAQTPVTSLAVVVFPADQRLWLPNARRVRAVRPSSDGRFHIDDLPGGAYLIAAVTDVAPEDLSDRMFLAQLAPGGIAIELPEGESIEQNLAVAH